MATLDQNVGRYEACLPILIQTQTVSIMIAPSASCANVICINIAKKEEGREGNFNLYCLRHGKAWRGLNNKDAM